MKKCLTLLLALGILTGCTSIGSQSHTSHVEQTTFENVPPFVLEAISQQIKKPVNEVDKNDLMKIEELVLNVGNLQENQKHIVQDLSVIASMKNLKHISIDHIPLKDVSFLSELPQLESFTLSGFQTNQLPSFDHFKNLKSLILEEGNISDLRFLQHLTTLENLNLRKNQITDITPIQTLRNLTFLDISENPIANIDSVKSLPNLERFQMRDTLIDKLDPLTHSKNLKYLDIRGSKVSSIKPLTGLNQLEVLLAAPETILDKELLPKNVKLSDKPITD